VAMRSCYFPNLFSSGCLPDDDEPFCLFGLALSHLLGPKATHVRGGPVLCSFQRRAAGGCITFFG
jgi:hypothetical protein